MARSRSRLERRAVSPQVATSEVSWEISAAFVALLPRNDDHDLRSVADVLLDPHHQVRTRSTGKEAIVLSTVTNVASSSVA
jgi:hypothetical protein